MALNTDIILHVTGKTAQSKFVAGAVWRDGVCIDVAPILRKYVRQEPTLDGFLALCKKLGWTVKRIGEPRRGQ